MNNAGNILKNYAVTEKADGYRYILYIDETKTGYLINSKMKVIKTGIVFTNVEGIWILDGEYIKYGITNDFTRFSIMTIFRNMNIKTKIIV